MTAKVWDVGIIGGGLGGLVTAALLAGRGQSVVLLERASATGGRAATRTRGGFAFNEGAHALYAGGAAARVLRGLGIGWTGRRPNPSGLAVVGGRPHKLPATVGALLTTSAVGWAGKARGARLFATLGRWDTRALDAVSWAEWAAREVGDPAMEAVFDAFVRVATYGNAPREMSAGAVIDQLRLALSPGVIYVDGGWGTIVDGASALAIARGATIRTSSAVSSAKHDGEAWGLSADVRCRSLILATGPSAARSILPSDAVASWATSAVPLHAACLDVALRRLPNPSALFALGVDAPLYLSVPSATAKLAPDGGALVSTMKYLAPWEAHDAKQNERELEALLDLLQPGWREVTIDRQWLPSVVASHALPAAATGGARGRPGPRVPDVPNAWIVGDWVGQEGMLLDASLASAETVADAVAAAGSLEKVA